ncbi:hypothetical protein GCM10009504_07510 [Pseudomonas laurentiana]|nr:hypothetical protein GCM10009504_07510 [Pseudomonas laurentiana]
MKIETGSSVFTHSGSIAAIGDSSQAGGCAPRNPPLTPPSTPEKLHIHDIQKADEGESSVSQVSGMGSDWQNAGEGALARGDGPKIGSKTETATLLVCGL